MTADDEPVLVVEDLVAGYGEANVIDGVSLRVGRGRLVAIVGPNGAGKSTFLRALVGLLPPRSGRVLLQGAGTTTDLTHLPTHRRAALGMGFVPQLENIFPSMTVRENLELGLGMTRRGREQVTKLLELFPLLARRAGARAGTLSGGQRQTVALARALVRSPSLLLLDEPSAGLAPAAVEELFSQLARVSASGTTLLLVEQNARRALAAADWGYVLDMGQNRYEGPGMDLLSDARITELYLGGLGSTTATRSAR
ncbi:MAG TPA: ABC transporter ATP-binding protein [Acidimicrobiales bacterium]|nr:ABC transporter ATP-binding protein [Acidimicrobiales bacterium]